MSAPPTGAFQASALPKQRMVCRWQNLCFCHYYSLWRRKGRREHLSPPATSSVGPATAVTIINLNFPPCFFPYTPIVTLEVDRGILFPQSPIGWNMPCSLWWGKGEESQQCLGGQWCVKCSMGHTHWEQFRGSFKAHTRVCFWVWLFTLVF